MTTKKILLIEDNPDMRDNTSEILALANYEVHAAPDGKKGVALARELKPDLIICDIMMPELDGYGVLNILSKDKETATIPFIFLSAKVERQDMRKGMDQGADDYLTKPYDDTELLNAVESRIQKSAQIKELMQAGDSGFDHFLDNVSGLEQLKDLPKNKKSKTFHKRDAIYLEGSIPNYLYYIQSGKIKVFKRNADGKEYITGMLSEGEYLGYASLLENQPYSESAEALEDSQVAMIPKDDFMKLVYGNREIAHVFIRMLSSMKQEQEDKLLKLAYDSVRMRVAAMLVSVADKMGRLIDGYVHISLSRDDLAGLVGTAKESAIRMLSDFRDEGLIEIKGHEIIIKNRDKLLKSSS